MVSVVKTVKNTERLRQILTVLARHGFGELIGRINVRALIPGLKKPETEDKKAFAVRLREAMQELGPSFVKLGQIISTRTDIVPEKVIVELKKLQDDVPPMSFEDVEEVLAETFGGLEAELFADIDETPLASASIGQVHKARVRIDDAELDVVIKVQRARIRGTIERDLDLLYILARLIERHIPESRIYSPVGMVSEFERAILAELDFGAEADHAEKFAQNFSGDPSVRFPYIYRAASGKRVLTMERFIGEKIYEFASDEQTAQLVAKNALHVVAKMIFEHGFFHADPHPGNIIMLGAKADPVIGMIDLGLVGRLSQDMRDKAIQLMLAAVAGDPGPLADALIAMGKPRGRIDLPAFRAEVAVLSEKYLGKPIAEVELAALIRDLVQGAVKYEIEMPVEMMMVGKSLMTIEGIGKEIYPELDVFTELRPYFLRLLWQRYSPERMGKELLVGLGRLSTSATRLPSQLDDILTDLRAGQLRVHAVDPDAAGLRDRLGRRLYSAVLSASLVVGASILLAAGRQSGLAWGLLSVAGAVSVFHLWGDYRREKRRT